MSEPKKQTSEDAWAYTPDMVARLRRTESQRAYVLGPDDLEKIARDAEVAHAAGCDYHVTEAELLAMEARHLAARNGQSLDR